MTSWRWPTLLTVLVLLVCTAYMGVRYGLGSKWPWYDLFFVVRSGPVMNDGPSPTWGGRVTRPASQGRDRR